MDAVKKKNIYHKSYFRHSVKGVDNERKCTFSNQDYRHKLAIEILQFSKRIKVPNLYSYSSDGKKAVLLEDAQFIEANHVRAELTFYEDDEGNVLHGKNPNLENKNLLKILLKLKIYIFILALQRCTTLLQKILSLLLELFIQNLEVS